MTTSHSEVYAKALVLSEQIAEELRTISPGNDDMVWAQIYIANSRLLTELTKATKSSKVTWRQALGDDPQ
jgi:hypothetical protein